MSHVIIQGVIAGQSERLILQNNSFVWNEICLVATYTLSSRLPAMAVCDVKTSQMLREEELKLVKNLTKLRLLHMQ